MSKARIRFALNNVVLSADNICRVGPRILEQAQKLVAKHTIFLFGEVDLDELLNLAYLTLAIYNDEDELVGLMCLDDHPNIQPVPPWEWEHFANNKYAIADGNTFSMLWIHFCAWDSRYATIFIQPMFEYIFRENAYLEKIFMVVPPGVIKLDFLDRYADRLPPVGCDDKLHRTQSLYVASRNRFSCQYIIRRAVEEDNDDLVAIIPEELRELYGQFYIAELLTVFANDGRQIIVAEYNTMAVGVLILQEEVNYDLLNQEFELIPFNGLKKHDRSDEVSDKYATTVVEDDVEVELRNDDVEKIQSLSYQAGKKIDSTMISRASSIRNSAKAASTRSNLAVAAHTSYTNSETYSFESDFSLVNLSSSLLLNVLYSEGGDSSSEKTSNSSIDARYSVTMLEMDMEGLDKSKARRPSSHRDSRTNRPAGGRKGDEGPQFRGTPNAFALEVAATIPGYEDALFHLFAGAFECFPNKDYCVACFPACLPSNEISKFFAKVVPRRFSIFPHMLYALHKCAILGYLRVRVAELDDYAHVQKLVHTLNNRELFEEQFNDSMRQSEVTSPFLSFVLLCEEKIIGVAIISEELEYDYIETHYELDSWIDPFKHKPGAHGCIENFIVSPIFMRHDQYFLRELHRLSHFSILYYRVNQWDYVVTSFNPTIRSPLVNVISTMVPLMPRRIQEYDQTIKDEYQVPPIVLKKEAPLAIYISTTMLTSLPRIEINNKLVLVGASKTCIDFLETFLFTNTTKCLATFTSVTVLSPHSIMYRKQPNRIRDMMFVSRGRMDRQYIDSKCLQTYVHTVLGVMTAINRKDKIVTVNDETALPYDTLILLCGEQFQKPPSRVPADPKKPPEFPGNFFIINTEADSGNALQQLKQLPAYVNRQQCIMVVYGHFLESLCCLAALLEFGVPGNELVFIDPPPDLSLGLVGYHEHITALFNNRDVEDAVMQHMRNEGVTIYTDYAFLEWTTDPYTNLITSARFESKYKMMDLQLSALFMYHNKSVSAKTYQAINKAGLVFDGHVVINLLNQTTDKNIYAAGSLTKYSSQYHMEHKRHKFYNSKEIGHNLALQIREKLLPEQYLENQEELKKHNEPVTVYCKMPGSLTYLHIARPGIPVPLEVAMSRDDYGKVLITGTTANLQNQGYFRLHVNKFSTVETITCLAKFDMHCQNLVTIYGKHERLLNKLLLRFEMGMIKDFYDYFNEPWCCAINHHHFHDLLTELQKIIATLQGPNGLPIEEELRNIFEANNWKDLNRMQIDEIEEMLKQTPYCKMIEEKVLDFIQENYHKYLPMYANGMLVRMIINQIVHSPMFVCRNPV